MSKLFTGEILFMLDQTDLITSTVGYFVTKY